MFTEITEECILKSERIDVPLIIERLRKMEVMVEESLRRGEVEFLPIGNAKDEKAYKDPSSEQTVRAVLAWNKFYPDKMIEVPVKVKLLKLNIFDLSDAEELKEKYPKEYNILYKEIFQDTTGYFISKRHDGKRNIDVPYVRGLQCIAIPMNEEIPEWIRPYIDYRTMVNNIMGPYKSVMELLKMPYVSEGKTKNGVSRKTKKLSNIIIF